jgi:DNA-binding response OmpR family regulator
MSLAVVDSGKGIAPQDVPNIFKRFYISRSSDQSQSHGIGLALAYDLLQIHKGNIKVESVLGKGSVFTFEVPLSINAYTEAEMSEEALENHIVLPIDETGDETLINDVPDEKMKDYTVMVVEDNHELQKLLVEILKTNYHVLPASNGVEALELVKSNEIDLIVSDVMMPEMDGLTFCKIIKTDVATSHIRMLMLTAKNSPQDRIECYNAGADAYIAKPFELEVLKARVKNILALQLRKGETFRNSKDIVVSEMQYTSTEKQFLNMAIKTAEKHLSDANFDFDNFAVEMMLSKSTLHRKLKAHTGLSPGEFIRNIRLKHSVQMLENNFGNISEIAFALGFNDPKYFSRCFKIEFGISPKEYIDNRKKTEET